MDVRLIVVSGKKAGEEVPIAVPRFFIGRAEDCHLRPHSELVSRHHCAIIVEESLAAIRDFGSKNGTFVNGERVRGEQELNTGDRLKVGDLEFEVRLGVGVGGKKKPKVRSVQEAAARTVESSLEDDMDLNSWLTDTDTQALESTHTDNGATETTRIETPGEELPPSEEKAKKKKQKPIEVVGVWKKSRRTPPTANPRDAAADTLKDFFTNRRE